MLNQKCRCSFFGGQLCNNCVTEKHFHFVNTLIDVGHPKYTSPKPGEFVEKTSEEFQKVPYKDEPKPKLDLVPPEAIFAIGTILTFGAKEKQYGERSWEEGMSYSDNYAALQRHLLKWWSGEDKDPESGKSHLWHALTRCVFLVCHEIWGVGRDDRPSHKRSGETEKTTTT